MMDGAPAKGSKTNSSGSILTKYFSLRSVRKSAPEVEPHSIAKEKKEEDPIPDLIHSFSSSSLNSAESTTSVSPLENIRAILREDNLQAFQDYLEKNKVGVNGKIEIINQPFLLLALDNNALKISLWLVKHGVSFNVAKSTGITFLEHILKSSALIPQQIEFLKKLQRKLKGEIKKQTTAEKDLSMLDEIFNVFLDRKRIVAATFNTLTRTPLNSTLGELPLVLYKICTQLPQNIKTALFDRAQFQQQIIGLLSSCNSTDVIQILADLQPYFTPEQKFVSHYAIIQIIRLDSFHHCFFKSTSLINFLKNKFNFDSELVPQIEQLIRLMRSISRPYLNASLEINHILMNYELHSKAINFEELTAAALATEMRSITGRFYQTVGITEFNFGAKSLEIQQNQAPHINAQQILSTNITHVLTQEILLKNSHEECAQIITRNIQAIRYLLNNENPDTHSAMLLQVVLDCYQVSALEKSFAMVDPQLLSYFRNLCVTTLTPTRNYKELREKMSANCFPYLGLYLFDVVFFQERKIENRMTLSGALFINFKAQQSTARKMGFPLCSTLLLSAQSVKIKDELRNDELDLLLYKKNEKPLVLNDLISIAMLKKLLIISYEKGYRFRVRSIGVVYEGEKALDTFFKWLKVGFELERFKDLHEISELIPLLQRVIPHLMELLTQYESKIRHWAPSKTLLMNKDKKNPSITKTGSMIITSSFRRKAEPM